MKEQHEVIDKIKRETAREVCEEIRKESSICLATQNGVELYHTKSYTIMAMKLDEIEKKYTEGE
jgi:hypothetical protein